METTSQTVTRLTSCACAQYPGGIRAVFAAIRERDGDTRSESAFYADLNANQTSLGKLKVRDFLACMEITGSIEPLRFLAAHFGYALTSLESVKPDAPTIEAEMLQDYPPVVAFHEEVRAYRQRKTKSSAPMLTRLDIAVSDLRQTAAAALDESAGE